MAPAGKQPTDRCMGFSKGKLGAAIVVLAILASILMGYFASIDGEERTYTDYNYITDVSGLFEYSDTPQYIEYDPASNYTGYTQNDVQMGGLDYTTSELANNYRITKSNPPTIGTITITSSTQYTNWAGYHQSQFSAVSPGGGTLYTEYTDWVLLTAVLDNLISLTDVQIVELTNVAGGGFGTSGSMNASSYDTVSYSVDNGVVTTIKGGISRTFESTDFYIAVKIYRDYTSGNDTTTYFSSQYTSWKAQNVIYLNPSDGVALNGTNAVQWSNTYNNGVISHVLRAKAWTDSSMTMTYAAQNSTFSSVTINTSSNGWSISVDQGEAVDIGKWKTIELTYDALNGEVSVTPVKTFYTFMDYVLYDSPTYDIGEGVQSPITGISLTGDGTANITFSVGTTDVFLNTYGAVMLDPSLNIFDYFTQYEKLRLNLYSFAIYGESITLNGVTYPVTAGQITVDEKAHDLQNIYITYADGHMSLTFVNDSATYDLGEYTDPTISFAGNWYFTTGLWEPYTATETVYEWTPGIFSASAPQLLIIFLGLVVAGLLIARRYYRPRLTDYAIIIGTAFVAVVVLGVF